MSSAQPPPAVEDAALSLVLFGLPTAGKSSLLAALHHVGSTGTGGLGGRLEGRTQALADLAARVAEHAPERTSEEVVAYPVRYQPAADLGRQLPAVDAVLLDCDGRVANDLLVRRQVLGETSAEGTLAREMSDADALIFVLDASMTDAEVGREFQEFGEFLKLLEKSRGERVEVAGLPVFLVLTKCDLLARPGDQLGAWMERIEERKREVDARFRAFLEEDEAKPPEEGEKPEEAEEPTVVEKSPFGSLELNVWATATRRPRGLHAGTQEEPYGVGELFRQAFASARAHRERCERSRRRLTGLVVGSLLLVGVMAASAAGLFVFGAASLASQLQARAEAIRTFDRGTAAERLRGREKELLARLIPLEEVREDPLFSRLPRDLREFITGRVEELNSYIPYLKKVSDEPSPAGELTEEGLDKSLARYRDDLALPDPAWADTPAGQLRRERLETGEAMRKAMQAVRNVYLDASDRAGRLWTFADYSAAPAIDWREWEAKTRKLLDDLSKPAFKESDVVPGVPHGVVSFATILRIDRVADARATWALDRAKLDRMLDLASALGVLPATKERPAALVFTADFTLAGAKARLDELKRAYPDYAKTFTRDRLPEAALPRLVKDARLQYNQMLVPARAEVLRQYRQAGKDDEETPARWDAVAAWLRKPEELAAWRELAVVLLRISDGTPRDPVTALAEFLAAKQFTLKVKSATLEIPDTRGLRPRAEARLTVYHKTTDNAVSLELTGEPKVAPDGRSRVYTYTLAETKTIEVKPGDRVWAYLPLAGDARDRLEWVQSRSILYTFEALRLDPRTAVEGRVYDDVRLTLRPEDGVPAVPDLLPKVR